MIKITYYQRNANQNYNEVSPHTKTKLKTINAGEDVEKRKLYCSVGRNVNWYSHYGEQYRDSFKN